MPCIFPIVFPPSSFFAFSSIYLAFACVVVVKQVHDELRDGGAQGAESGGPHLEQRQRGAKQGRGVGGGGLGGHEDGQALQRLLELRHQTDTASGMQLTFLK
jgi:hypothetical protein